MPYRHAADAFVPVQPYLKIDCGLGEAPFHEEKTNTLRFVDIIGKKIYAIDLDRGPGSLAVLGDLDVPVGVTADIEGTDADILIAAKTGFAVFNRKTQAYREINRIWDERDGDVSSKEKRMRFNDGAVDSHGRFWAGAMDDPTIVDSTDEGVLFRLDPDGSLHRVLEGVTIPNGIGWSMDDKTMYFTDSPTKNIFAFDFDAATGEISNRRVFFHVEHEEAVPDGFAIDEDGYVWTALFGGGRVLRISPEGKVVGEILLPTRCISCPGFAGDELFITSAAEEEPDKYPESKRYAGSLFRCKVGVRGQLVHRSKYQIKT
ncbi:MAG: hypothetical protein M1819_003403 [Sarea resinae]|nr:MAG: hypothetical protein M1819_003403 [Sarea resinae]